MDRQTESSRIESSRIESSRHGNPQTGRIPLLEARAVRHTYSELTVLDGIDLTIRQGEFVAIVGPSGCGKTTLLNLFSGFEKPMEGEVHRHADMRMVYQQGGLLPWLTVLENIRLGLRSTCRVAMSGKRPLPKKERLEQENGRLAEAVRQIGLEGFENHYPHQLSGGMRQRVELARALIGDSGLLLMDEPFSALDYMTRLRMRHELARLLQERPRTVVLVTHDIEEAAQLADRIILLSPRPGRIVQELQVPLSRPRSLTDPVVTRTVHKLLEALNLDVASFQTEYHHAL